MAKLCGVEVSVSFEQRLVDEFRTVHAEQVQQYLKPLEEFRDREALDGVAAWLEKQPLTVDVGGAHIESAAGWLLRLVHALQQMGPRDDS